MGQRQHHDIERAARQLLEQNLGLRFPQLDLQFRTALLQGRQNARQQVGCNGRDHTEPQSPGERPSVMAGKIDEIARFGQDPAATPRHLKADVGQRHLALAALNQLDPEQLLKVPDLHRKGWLRHRTGARGPAKMPVFSERLQITQLSKGEHADKII